MNKPVKLIAIGNSTGVILPKEMLARLRVEQGDTLTITESPDGFQFHVRDAEFEEQMTAARDVMKRRRNALRELAK